MDNKRFQEILERFSNAKVAVFGDFFLDLYIQLDRSLSELSLETRKEAFQAVDLRGQPGTAGVVTNNLRALGVETAAICFLGDDGNGFTMRQALENNQVNTDYVIIAEDRFTPTYTKPMMKEIDDRIVEQNRIDIINRTPNSPELNQALAENLRRAAEEYDGILVVEQVNRDGYGNLSPLVRSVLSEIARRYPEKVIIADSRHFTDRYRNISLKMNLSEAIQAAQNLGIDLDLNETTRSSSPVQSCVRAFWEFSKKPVFITLGEEGICGMSEGEYFHHPGYHVQGPVDIVGAGDSVMAGLGLAFCVGATPQEAAYVGNLVGSVTVEQIGTTGIATIEDLRRRHLEYQSQIINRK